MAGERNIHMGSGNYNERIEGDYVQGSKFSKDNPTLAEAAAEIQALLKQLEERHPTSTEAEQKIVADKAVKKIENNPALKRRVISAVKKGSLAALEKAVDHPAGAFVVGAVEGWQEVR